MNAHLEAAEDALSNLSVDDISKLIHECLNGGIEPNRIIESMSSGIGKVGKKFEKGEYFLPELIMAGGMMKEGL